MSDLNDELERLQRENETLRLAYDKQHELMQRENKELRDELAALKQESTEQPVGVIMNNTFLPTMSMDDLRPGNVYYTPPTATALVEDFKRRAIEACSTYSQSNEEMIGGLKYEEMNEAAKLAIHSTCQTLAFTIADLPLIKGEKE